MAPPMAAGGGCRRGAGVAAARLRPAGRGHGVAGRSRLPAPSARGQRAAHLRERRQRARARPVPKRLREKGVAGLVSFGLAIGLAPVLRPGDVVIADSVVLPGGKSIATDGGVARGAAPASRRQRPERAGGAHRRQRRAADLGRAPSAGRSGRPSPRRSTPTATRSPRSRRRPACRSWWCARSPSRPTRCGRRLPSPRTAPTVSRAASRWSATWPSGRGRSRRRLALLQERQAGARRPAAGRLGRPRPAGVWRHLSAGMAGSTLVASAPALAFPQCRRVVLRRGGDGNTVRRRSRPWLPPQL